jgi:hypothetical protein
MNEGQVLRVPVFNQEFVGLLNPRKRATAGSPVLKQPDESYAKPQLFSVVDRYVSLCSYTNRYDFHVELSSCCSSKKCYPSQDE